MLKLIKQAQQSSMTLTEQAANLHQGLTVLSKTFKEDVMTVNESISHVMANISQTISAGKPLDPKLAYGQPQTLAAYLAGIERLTSSPTPTDGVRKYLDSVAVQNGQITNMNMVGKVGQIGNEKNQQRRNELLAAIEAYNANPKDQASAQVLLTSVGKIRQLADKIANAGAQQPQQQPGTQPQQRPQQQPTLTPAPQKPVMS
jgi:hypothetical protein